MIGGAGGSTRLILFLFFTRRGRIKVTAVFVQKALCGGVRARTAQRFLCAAGLALPKVEVLGGQASTSKTERRCYFWKTGDRLLAKS